MSTTRWRPTLARLAPGVGARRPVVPRPTPHHIIPSAHPPCAAALQAGTKTKGLGGFQELDQIPVFSTVTKYQADVNNNTRIPELTARALDIALHERGPVQINIPRDHFYHDDHYKIPTPSKLEHSAGDAASLQRAVELIKGAKNPVILAGGGVCMGNAVDEVKALAEFLGAPVATTYLHNDSFPCDHQLACGSLGYQGSRAAMNAMHEADLVLALGSRLSPFGCLPQYGFDYFPKDAKIVQVDIDGRRLGLTQPVDVPVQGDCKKTAAELLAHLQTLSSADLAFESTKGDRLARIVAFKVRDPTSAAPTPTPAELAPSVATHAPRTAKQGCLHMRLLNCDVKIVLHELTLRSIRCR